MDQGGNGSVTSAEKTAFDAKLQDKQASLAFPAQQIAGPSNADVFAATDTDGDGAASLSELSNDDAATGVSSESLKTLFALIDGNGDGSISETESSSFLESVKSAVNEQRPPPPEGGPPPGGGPGAAQAASTPLHVCKLPVFTRARLFDLPSSSDHPRILLLAPKTGELTRPSAA